MSIKFKLTNDELVELYETGISGYEIAKIYNVNKKTVYDRLHQLPNWETLKYKHHGQKIKDKQDLKKYKGVCIGCGVEFTHYKKKNFCENGCYKSFWQKEHRSQNKEEINRKKREQRSMKEKKKTERQLWLEKFEIKAATVHKRKLSKFAERIDKRCSGWKNSLVSRSKKANVECNVTIEELRQLMYDSYGSSCKYCGRQMDINNLVIDHIIPISKGGTSNIDNLQVICKSSNAMKGSLDNDNFKLLLEWLNTEAPEELKKDLSIRLARGIH